MRLAGLLRLTAIGIAVLCCLDPPVIVALPQLVAADAAIVRSPADDRPASNEGAVSVLEAARRVGHDLSDALAGAGTVRIHEVAAGDRLPCDALQPCVVITGGAALGVPADRKGPVSVVRVGEAISPNVDIRRLSIPDTHLAGQATATVVMASAGVEGRASRVRLFDGEAVVGEATHNWTSDGEVSLEVPWWPLRGGPQVLITRVDTNGVEERTTLDNEMAARVEVEDARWPILIVERRASWAATFVRRALEGDARFEVAAQTDLAPRVSVSTAARRQLDDLDDVRVVVVGGPDALTVADVDRLDRFVRVRGGAVVLVPDRPISGPATRLVHHRWHERLDAGATSAGPLRASEWWLAAGTGPLDLVWGQSSEGAAVVATPVGAGVVVISGALDAWRHRSADGAYDTFWRATVARLAGAVGPAVALELSSEELGASGEVTARLAAHTTRMMATWQVTARRICDQADVDVVRLWPADATGAFFGRVPVGTRDGCRVEASIAGLGSATAQLAEVAVGNRHLRWDLQQMQELAARTGGLFIDRAGVGSLADSWLHARGAEPRPEPRYPMRSWWWAVPFVACLSGEWWLRRRAGLR
jgi:hypothetical protein